MHVAPLELLASSDDARKRGMGSGAWIEKSVGVMSLKSLPDAALAEDGSMVEWKYPDDLELMRPLPDDYTGVLGKFMALRRVEQIPPFIERYGKLNLCGQHQRPWTHNSHVIDWDHGVSLDQLAMPDCVPSVEPKQGVEPVAVWLDFVSNFRALLALSVGVREKKKGILEHPGWSVIKEQLETLEQARVTLAHHVNCHLEIGGVRPQLLWAGDSDGPRFAYPNADMGLFGVLALQLAMLVTMSDGIYTCSGCGDPYPRTGRKPKPGQDNWCPVCRAAKKPHRLRMQRLRAKRRSEKGTEEHGKESA